ncbi:MAG: cell division protein SepF [Acutalibacteraceae bacterium]|nr:cell division protein SepF [Clostridia bacterium]MBQ2001552.1 cell division protein SepF [Clostridia bacterium]MBQ2387928.1 cell division protein SepF [Clostridia bacterium]MEE1127850.1 cell division protein SepF [Acutalibacteraceae bacterium]
MGIKDKLSGFFRAQEDEYDDFEGAYDDYEDEAAPASYAKDTSSDKQKVVSMRNHAQLQVVLVKPERFEDAPSIADHLNNKHTVVLNLEKTPKDVQRRLIDFLSGVAYANNGLVKRVAVNTFMITPYNVDVMGDMLIDEIEGGTYR